MKESDGVTGETAEAPARPFTSRLKAAGRWLAAVDFNEPLIVLSLLALCVLVKLLWLTPVDTFWDAGAKWHFVRQWSYANDFSQAPWSHHMARVGVNFPTYLVQRLLGMAPPIYYVVPVASFTLQTLFVYLLGRRLGGRGAGTLGALFMIFNTGMTRSASQLLPDGIAATAVVLGGYALVRFHEEQGTKRLGWLFGVGLSCIWAYAIKESSVLLFPGVCVAVWISRRSFKEAAILVGMIGAYGALESAAFRLFTPYAHRLAVVQEKHGFYPPTDFWGLFERFVRLEPASQMLFWIWVMSLFYHAGSRDKRRSLLMLVPLGFVFFLTFLVRRIDPLIVWQSAKPRYMAPAMGLMVVGASLLVSDALQRAWATWEWPVARRLPGFLARESGLWVFCLCAMLGGRMYAQERPFHAHPLKVLRRDEAVLNDAFRRNLPIVEEGQNPRALNTIYAVYLRPEYLARSDLAQGGRLPNIQEGVRFIRRGGKHAYILRDASAYAPGDLKKLTDGGCAVTATARPRLKLSALSELPEACKAPRGEPIPP